MNEQELNKIIIIEQLPIISEQLKVISDNVDKEIKKALSLECTEESKIEVKNARTKLNNIKTILEEKRKMVKNAIMNPYDEFEKIYKKLALTKLNNADLELKTKIDKIENEQKEKGIKNLQEFANEYFVKNHIENLVDFDKIGLHITLTDLGKNLEGTKYKKEIVDFCDRISNDLKLIDIEEYKEEIMIEYKNNLDFSKSKLEVVSRHKLIEELIQKKEELDKIKQQEEQIIEKVEEIIAPIEIKEEQQEELYTITFTIKNVTTKQVVKIKDLLEKENIDYE